VTNRKSENKCMDIEKTTFYGIYSGVPSVGLRQKTVRMGPVRGSHICINCPPSTGRVIHLIALLAAIGFKICVLLH
jgi:hypothetical protein